MHAGVDKKAGKQQLYAANRRVSMFSAWRCENSPLAMEIKGRAFFVPSSSEAQEVQHVLW